MHFIYFKGVCLIIFKKRSTLDWIPDTQKLRINSEWLDYITERHFPWFYFSSRSARVNDTWQTTRIQRKLELEDRGNGGVHKEQNIKNCQSIQYLFIQSKQRGIMEDVFF